MSELETRAEIFRTEVGEVLRLVQSKGPVDATALERIDGNLREIARVLKGQSLVPKSLLNEIRVAAKIFRAEARYADAWQNEMVAMADRLEMTLDLILLGESHDDRRPGAPRTI